MSKLTYRSHLAGIIVSPEGEPIYSEMSTHVGLDDEGAGAFVTVMQPNCRAGREGIAFDATEWPEIRKAIETMLGVAQGIEAVRLPVERGDERPTCDTPPAPHA